MIIQNTPVGKQKGAVLVLIAFSIFIILGMAGLAIDLGHSYVNKARVQNAVDSAALSAVISVLEDIQANPGTSVSTATAIADATNTFLANVKASGNWEINTTSVDICFSTSLNLFPAFPNTCLTAIPASSPGVFARATAIDPQNGNSASIPLKSFIIQVMGFSSKAVGGVSVAGTKQTDPSSTEGLVCDVNPFFVCGGGSPIPTAGTDAYDDYRDCSDNDCFGIDDITVTNKFFLKNSPKCDGSADEPAYCGTAELFGNDAQKNGNFLFAKLLNGDGTYDSGQNNIRDNIVNPKECLDGDISTQPGVGSSFRHAINSIFQDDPNVTDFGDLSNDSQFTTYADSDFSQPIDYSSYTGTGEREIAVNVADCTNGGTPLNGAESLPHIGFACFFLTTTVEGPGINSYLIGEMIPQEVCGITNDDTVDTETPGSSLDIVLYEYYDSNDG